MKASAQNNWRGLWGATPLTLFALALHGYHPYAEDGGVYMAGIKRVLHPAMYGVGAEFVTAPMRTSLFAPIVAGIVRGTHLSLPWTLLALYLVSMGGTLYAAWMLISRSVASEAGRMGAVALLACWLTMPIAGTSLMLMDPYVTARSISTPLVLMSLAWTMDAVAGRRRGFFLANLALTLAALVHPLMAGYGLAAALLLAATSSRRLSLRRWGPWAIAAAALTIALTVQVAAPPESEGYVRIAMTRYYWFPLRWQWYEQIGLFAPLAVLLYLHSCGTRTCKALDRTAVELGAISLLVSILFARESMAAHAVAALQPLRCFQLVYEIMILLLGAVAGERWLRTNFWRWAAVFALCGGTMFFVQRSIYPASDHLELPWRAPANRWVQAFLWARQHTPTDALFALDARYITRGPGEDAQCFRATAERNALPDYSKDGGEASIAPRLTDAWVRGQAAQAELEQENDTVRAAKLKPLGVTWAVLEASSATAWPCPYANASVKICRLP